MYYTSAVILLFAALALQVKLKAHVSLFGGEPGVGLNALRYKRYLKKNLLPRRLILSDKILPNRGSYPIPQPVSLPKGKVVAGTVKVQVCRWRIGGG